MEGDAGSSAAPDSTPAAAERQTVIDVTFAAFQTSLKVHHKSEKVHVVSNYLPLRENFHIRMFWAIMEIFLLSYTATILPFRLCFLELHIPEELPENETWLKVEFPIDVLFWVDLMLHFFCTYRDSDGNEVLSWKLIWINYLTHGFLINLISCLPDEAYLWMLSGVVSGGGDVHGMNQAVKLVRLKRVTKLLRVLRGGAKVAKLFEGLWRFKVVVLIMRSKKWRIAGFIFGFFLSAHWLACVWYLIAVMDYTHGNTDQTWLAQREILDARPFKQWLTCVYFTITVFTSVGFGDMSGSTALEMAFVSLLMVFGTIIDSTIAGEIIGLLVRSSEYNEWRVNQQCTVDRMLHHFQMDGTATARQITFWMHCTKITRVDNQLSDVKKILASGVFPENLQERLVREAFQGVLLKNKFITLIEKNIGQVPRRLVLFLALSGFMREYECNEEVYKAKEHPWNIYLVFSGAFAEVGHVDPNWSDVCFMNPFKLYLPGEYFGEYELWNPQVRQSNVRCEEKGACLVISKTSFQDLLVEFSEYDGLWKSEALARSQRAKVLRARLPAMQGKSYADLMALRIQRWFRFRASLGLFGFCHVSVKQPSMSINGHLEDNEVVSKKAFEAEEAAPSPRLHDQHPAHADIGTEVQVQSIKCRALEPMLPSVPMLSSVPFTTSTPVSPGVDERLTRLEHKVDASLRMLSELLQRTNGNRDLTQTDESSIALV